MRSRLEKLDIPLINRAMRERWEIPESARRDATRVCYEAIQAKDVKYEDKVKAINTLARLDALNLKFMDMTMARGTVNIEDLSDEELNQVLTEAMNPSGDDMLWQLKTVTVEELVEGPPDARPTVKHIPNASRMNRLPLWKGNK